jgi:ParB family transcriptional regulator, chromosome partitioning protein
MDMSKTKAATALNAEQFIPLNRLKKSPRNARKTPHAASDIEALASSIASHGMLQAPVVEPETRDGKPTGCYLVTIGEGRRQAQLLRAKRKEIAKNEPIRCLIETTHDAFEISLAENAIRSPIRIPLTSSMLSIGCTPSKASAPMILPLVLASRRPSLSSVSSWLPPRLIQAYRDGELSFAHLSAFAITDDQKRQEKVFDQLRPDDDRADILASLGEDQIPASDPRAVFVGRDAYVAAGGGMLADLFDAADEGFFTDAALLADLATRKLEKEAEVVRGEGWKWIEVLPRMDYELVQNCRRIYPEPRPLSEADAEQLAALEEQYRALEVDNVSRDTRGEAERLDTAIEALKGDDVYDPDDVARAGVIVTLSHDGTLSVQRGFVRKEDDPKRAAKTEKAKEKAKEGPAPLSEKLVAELTATRTAYLRDALAQNSTVAVVALLHSLALQVFYKRNSEGGSCLTLRFVERPLEPFAPGIEESEPVQAMQKRHASWAARLPEEAADLWTALGALGTDEKLELLAHCTARALDCVQQPKAPNTPNAAPIIAALGFDMAPHWKPTEANFFARVSKDRILDAVREGVSIEAAENLATLKKGDLAKEAAARLKDKGWLPLPLRNALGTSAPQAH